MSSLNSPKAINMDTFYAIVVVGLVIQLGPADAQGQCSSSSLARSINDFGFDLTSNLDQDGNITTSPFSIYVAMAMTYDGAAGSSADQISDALRLSSYGLTNDDLMSSAQRLLEDYNSKKMDYTLDVADGIFIQDDFSVREDFIEDMEAYYKALVRLLDFESDPNGAKNVINSFVANKTRNKIRDLFSSPLDPSTKLVLINAIYFKGTWKIQFNKKDTYDGTFYKYDNQQKKVKLMQLKKQKFRFYESLQMGYKFLELPYKGEDIVMLLALPKDRNQFPDLEMDSITFRNIQNNLQNQKVNKIVVPKFKLQYKKQLKNVLKTLGIVDIFDQNSDLSGIVEDGRLVVSSVLHKAIIEVNEEGSEAAAATGVGITSLARPVAPPPTIEFVADHPFLFYIYDKTNKIVLFSGRVTDP